MNNSRLSPSTKAEQALAACVEQERAKAEIRAITKLIGDALSGCPDATHLQEAYAFDIDEDEGEGRRVYLTPEGQLEVLSACPYCLAAHHAIQARKVARKRLGKARRAVTMIGRAA